MAAREQPGRIEPAVSLAVIRQPVNVPMPDERRIGGIDGRAAADENDAARKARQHVLWGVGAMNFDDVAVVEGKVWQCGEGAVAHNEYVAACQLEETLDIGDIFAAAIAFPRQTAAEPELAAEADGDDGANVCEFPSVHGIPRDKVVRIVDGPVDVGTGAKSEVVWVKLSGPWSLVEF